jgi:hypothetical protein
MCDAALALGAIGWTAMIGGAIVLVVCIVQLIRLG